MAHDSTTPQSLTTLPNQLKSVDFAPSTKINTDYSSHQKGDDDQNDGEDEESIISPRSQLRSIPPWVLTPEITNNRQFSAQPLLLRPETPLAPHHQYLPSDPAAQRSGRAAKGRRWDHLRTAEPALLDQTLDESSSRWLPFMLSGPQYRPADVFGAEVMGDDWMGQNIPAWSAGLDELDESNEKRRSFLMIRKGGMARMKRTMLKNPFVPLVFRLITVIFTLTALGLGVRIYRRTDNAPQPCSQRASTYIAVIVDSIAVPYILYVTWDEYTSKPLGLRSATAKMSLLLVDLYFIVFYSSNLSLSFGALTDRRWACYREDHSACLYNEGICSSQRALSGVLIVALLAWMITFSLSVLRVVKRLT